MSINEDPSLNRGAMLSKLDAWRRILRSHVATHISPDCEERNVLEKLLDLTKYVEKTSGLICGGSFGDVFRAKTINLPIADKIPELCVKVMRVCITGDRASKSKRFRIFERELYVWQRLEHKNVIPLLGRLTWEEQPAMVSFWMVNGTAKDYITEHSSALRMPIISGVTDGLIYLHSQNPEITHGDLKAENILIDEEGNPLLCDFGLSRMVEDTTIWHTTATRAGGTLRWQAPELMSGDVATASIAGDVYAYAMTSYEIITGKVPYYEHRNDGAVLKAVLMDNSKPSKPSGSSLAELLWSVWSDCWATEPARRLTMPEVQSRLAEQKVELDRQDSTAKPGTSIEAPQQTSPFKFLKGELIGKGSYAKVYLALNATTGEFLALKQIPLPEASQDMTDNTFAVYCDVLRSEIRTLQQLQHVNVVQYLGCSEEDGMLNLFLEYVPGGSIGSMIHRYGSFDQTVIQYFCGQILDGLEYLHSKGYIHRDIKGDNILVTTDGICKISDFAIAEPTRKKSAYINDNYTTMQGSVFWMAPEVVTNPGEGYSAKADVWSLGCVWHEMYFGRSPWHGDGFLAVLFRLGKSRIPPSIEEGSLPLPALAESFRNECFLQDPDERPTAATLRQHEYLVLPTDWRYQSPEHIEELTSRGLST